MDENNYTLESESTKESTPVLLKVTMESIGFLKTIAKWTKFFAILGFIAIGLMALGGIAAFVMFSFLDSSSFPAQLPFPTKFLGFIYLIFAGTYLMPAIYLNNFSNYLSSAIGMMNSDMLTQAFSNLKSHYKYMGMITIILICFYILIIGGVMIFAMSHVMHTI
jgi:hypothetical protein